MPTTTANKRPCPCVEDYSNDPDTTLMRAAKDCEICDGTGEVSELAVKALDDAANAIDQMRGDLGTVANPDARRVLGIAWWMIEDQIRELTGACSMGKDCKSSPYCGVCSEYKNLRAKALHIRRAL